jgi:C4-dicarboxylate-specific signal transduction histidine kinase
MFGSVADNLLQNALAKRQNEAALHIHVSLSADAALMRVCDNGSRVPVEFLTGLLRAPVASDNGLGIGLYNSARQAGDCGYQLALASNAPGDVCFELRLSRADSA